MMFMKLREGTSTSHVYQSFDVSLKHDSNDYAIVDTDIQVPRS